MLSFREKQFMMTYPIPFCDENHLSDYSYLEELYPVTIKAYQVKVKEAVDEIDYPGSIIYDEYPDAMIMYRMIKRISDQISLDCVLKKQIDEEIGCEQTKEEVKEGPCKLIELIQVLFYMEIHKRRVSKEKGISVPFYQPEYGFNRIRPFCQKEIIEGMTQNEVEKMTKTIYNKE